MAAFEYVALDPQGKKARGIVEADSPRSARSQLREQRLTPLAIDAARERSRRTSLFQRRLSAYDIALFTRQLATLLQAGIPLENALNAVANQSEKAHVKRVILAIRSHILGGLSLARSLEDFPGIFSRLYISTIETGEKSGHLDLVLEKLADYTESQQAFRQQVQLALIYPVLLVILSLAIVVGLMAFVVPEILNVILEAGQALPLATEILVALSNLVTQHGHWLVLVVVILCAGCLWALKQPRLRKRWHQCLLNAWGIRRFSRSSNAARYTSTLAILIRSGITLNDAMPIASEVCANDVFRAATQSAQQGVHEGRSLFSTLTETRLFPPMLLQLIASGEQSGGLGEMLQRAADSQENDLRQRVKTMVSLFEPFTLLLMGCIVLGIVLAVLMPILNLNQLVS